MKLKQKHTKNQREQESFIKITFQGGTNENNRFRNEDEMISLELPIYYTFTKKTKKDNKVLVGMNWYRNAHFRNSNQVKQHYHKLIYSKVTQSQKLKDKYMVSYSLYPSNSKCDLMNVVSVIDKFLNDALQDCGVIVNDNIKFYKHMIATVKEVDKLNPRIEIIIEEME